ncbi:DUF1330 domain-containing protein [Parasphingopyxis algicola]|uniref:DUF1330 domain-containing protein n=1 Tax=Parasphingopyxis algicola TaxID=2026624 RepID=UPI0015A20683|nr:DUF1330 domain-containing protein [Parasphingopyxis algicola]QLC24519.1 DUF1330 domain-containing protein [Parasphingopyxis algicola]
MTEQPHLDVTPEAGRDFIMRGIQGPVVMLNLLRFRETADYTGFPDIAPAAPISGAEAFDLYVAHTLPFLQSSGGELLFLGDGGPWLIGPAGERWDKAMLVRQVSVDSFVAWSNDAEYLTGIGHRTAAIKDARMLPLIAGEAAEPAQS